MVGAPTIRHDVLMFPVVGVSVGGLIRRPTVTSHTT
jgi:hypothetical protein